MATAQPTDYFLLGYRDGSTLWSRSAFYVPNSIQPKPIVEKRMVFSIFEAIAFPVKIYNIAKTFFHACKQRDGEVAPFAICKLLATPCHWGYMALSYLCMGVSFGLFNIACKTSCLIAATGLGIIYAGGQLIFEAIHAIKQALFLNKMNTHLLQAMENPSLPTLERYKAVLLSVLGQDGYTQLRNSVATRATDALAQHTLELVREQLVRYELEKIDDTYNRLSQQQVEDLRQRFGEDHNIETAEERLAAIDSTLHRNRRCLTHRIRPWAANQVFEALANTNPNNPLEILKDPQAEQAAKHTARIEGEKLLTLLHTQGTKKLWCHIAGICVVLLIGAAFLASCYFLPPLVGGFCFSSISFLLPVIYGMLYYGTLDAEGHHFSWVKSLQGCLPKFLVPSKYRDAIFSTT